MLGQIEVMYNEMRDLTLKAGVKAEDYVLISSELTEESPIAIKEEVFKFLSEVHRHWIMASSVWELLPPKIWEQYKLLKITGLAEQILLEKSFIEIRKSWRNFIKTWKSRKPVI